MNISHLAYKFRLDYQISHMPLDCDQLTYTLRQHFRILSYSEAEAELVRRECYGFTLELSGFALTDEFGQTTIYISDYISREKRLSVLLHELGHVLCGHCRRLGPVVGYGGEGDPAQEQEANEFALNVLAPVCYLAKLRVQSPKDVQAVTGVREEDARILYRQVLQYRQESHLITRLEKRLVKMMNRRGERPSFHPGQKLFRGVAAAALIAVVIIAGVCFCSPYFEEKENLPAFLHSSGSSQNYGGSVPSASAEDKLVQPGRDSEPVSALYPDGGPPDSQSSAAEENERPHSGHELDLVWFTRYGECYHRADCQHVRDKETITEVEQWDAVKRGLRACTVCRPDD